MEENDEEEKEPINIELTEQKTEPYNDENAIEFRWSSVKKKKTRKIFLDWLHRELAKANWWGKLFKKVTGWLFDDCGIVPNEKN